MGRNSELIRQWTLLRQLANSRANTIPTLAEDLGVSTRTVRRDLIALQTAGFPIYDETSDTGTKFWRMDPKAMGAMARSGLTFNELSALYFSRALLECFAGTPMLRDLQGALDKVEAALSPAMKKFLDRLPRVISAKAPHTKRQDAHTHQTMARLLEASVGHRIVTMRYHSQESAREKDYVVHPCRLVHVQGGLYLIAFVPAYGEVRTFAIERVRRVTLQERTFEPLPELDSDPFKNSLGVHRGPAMKVQLRFHRSIAPSIRERTWHASQQLKDRSDGSVVMTLQVSDDYLRGRAPVEARVVITTAPGEEGQVDYGDGGPMVRDPRTGKYRRTRLFVLTLGCSRKSVRLLVWRSSAQIWAELHERAFRRLGGTVRVIVLDNLKEGVLTPDIYDPALNPLYRDVLAHYGAVALPCRVGDPDRKGKVEAGVGHAQKTPLKGLRFESLDAAQAYLDRWETRWADTRIHGTTKRQVAVMFAEERPALGPLPLEPFRYYRYGERTVHLDGCVEVEAAYYGAPPGWIGQRVQVQWNDLHVRLLAPQTGQLLREHLRATRGWHRIHDDDRPARTPASTVALLARATTAGAHMGALCTYIHQHEGASGVRRMLGVLALAKKHGPAVVDEAAKAALDLGVPTYRFLRRYLERRLPVPLTLRQVDPLIRQLTLYRDLIDRKTGDPV